MHYMDNINLKDENEVIYLVCFVTIVYMCYLLFHCKLSM